MFATVITFDNESDEELAAGVSHVRDEVIPALDGASGLDGWWLVDRAAGRRLTLMVWESQEQYDAGMAQVQAARAQDPDRPRPSPTSVTRYDVYGSLPYVSE